MTDLLARDAVRAADGSSRVRVFEWLDRLELPAEVVVAMPDGRPATVAGWVDLAGRSAAACEAAFPPGRARTFWLHREVSPLSPGVLEASMLRNAGVALFDLDDALFVEPERSARACLLLRRRAKAELCARRADVVVAGNEFIAEWAASLGARPEIVPSCVDPSVYVPKATTSSAPSPGSSGWDRRARSRTSRRSLPVLESRAAAPPPRAGGDRAGGGRHS